MYCFKWPGIKKIQLVKGQKSNHLHNIFYQTGTDLCIYKEVRAELSVWSGVNRCKGLFHMMHWADIIRNNACKCSTSFKSSFSCCADEKGEHYINNDTLHITSVHCSPFFERAEVYCCCYPDLSADQHCRVAPCLFRIYLLKMILDFNLGLVMKRYNPLIFCSCNLYKCLMLATRRTKVPLWASSKN